MSTFDQVPYNPGRDPVARDIFADNPDPRCPVVLLLDKSGSMAGAPIEALNASLVRFKAYLSRDALAVKRAEIAVVSFGPITADVEFEAAGSFEPPVLSPEGDTPMGRAIELALDMLAARKQTYKDNGVAYYRPMVFLLTDGAPSDSWQAAARRVREEEAAKRVAFFAVGVEGADFATLAKIATREPIRLPGLDYDSLFQWLSASLSAVSRSQPGTAVALPPVPRGWGEL